jgi:hypothetical protein
MKWILIISIGLLTLSACVSRQPVPTDGSSIEAGDEQKMPTVDSDTGSEAIELPQITLLPPQSPPIGAAREFQTDFSIASIYFDEILSGGPPKDGIPSIDSPEFVTVDEADLWLKDVEPVIQLEVDGEARAYPLQVLTWHEIVNDVIGNTPVLVTFCPLCNTAIAFERSLDGVVHDFGTTGRLRYSNLIMYDRQTETWWQQATGEAIVGEMTGKRLNLLPAAMIAWSDFRAGYPEGLVLSRDTGHNRPYGSNPYLGYDDVNNPPFLYQGPETPDRLPPVARVLAAELNGEAAAYPYDVLEEEIVVNDSLGGIPVVVIWAQGTASALDAAIIAEGRDVGAANLYERIVDGRTLTFELQDQKVLDRQTGSEWNVLGRAVAGELQGKQLTPLVAVNHFWFSWAAFMPDTRIYPSETP